MEPYRTNVEGTFDATVTASSRLPVAGDRSHLFVFRSLEDDKTRIRFGAAIEEITIEDDGSFTAQLAFWSDLAQIYATPGSEFEVWYSNIIGRGRVLSPSWPRSPS